MRRWTKMGEKPRDKACLSSWRRQAPIAVTSIPLTFIGLCGLDGERYEKAATHIVHEFTRPDPANTFYNTSYLITGDAVASLTQLSTGGAKICNKGGLVYCYSINRFRENVCRQGNIITGHSYVPVDNPLPFNRFNN